MLLVENWLWGIVHLAGCVVLRMATVEEIWDACGPFNAGNSIPPSRGRRAVEIVCRCVDGCGTRHHARGIGETSIWSAPG